MTILKYTRSAIYAIYFLNHYMYIYTFIFKLLKLIKSKSALDIIKYSFQRCWILKLILIN